MRIEWKKKRIVVVILKIQNYKLPSLSSLTVYAHAIMSVE